MHVYGEALRGIRLRLHLTQDDAARLVGRSRALISLWESGVWPTTADGKMSLRIYLAALWHAAIERGVVMESRRRDLFPDLYSEE